MMYAKLIIDGNAVYEIDEECLNKAVSKSEYKEFRDNKQKPPFPNVKKGVK